MAVSSSVFLVTHPMPGGNSPCCPPHPVACHDVFLFLTAVYHVTPAAARRAFRRVPSRRELSLQVVGFLALLRRCQALLLSHEGATGHELEPYSQHVVRPIAPLVL